MDLFWHNTVEMSKPRQTRKKRPTHITLVELKSSFDQLRKGAAIILRESKNKKQRIRKFQALCRGLFQHPVEPMAAEAYLSVVERGESRRGATRRKQKGGMAPLDFQTRPGIEGVHGSYPQYLTGGLGFMDTVNKEGMFQDCGKVDITPVVPVSIGSNQFGGGQGVSVLTTLNDALFLGTTHPVSATVPANPMQNAQNAWLGKNVGASPRPDQNPLKYI